MRKQVIRIVYELFDFYTNYDTICIRIWYECDTNLIRIWYELSIRFDTNCLYELRIRIAYTNYQCVYISTASSTRRVRKNTLFPWVCECVTCWVSYKKLFVVLKVRPRSHCSVFIWKRIKKYPFSPCVHTAPPWKRRLLKTDTFENGDFWQRKKAVWTPKTQKRILLKTLATTTTQQNA